ncbi:hypothetical protein Hdeb2414_s0020g00554371 [Helianthus debilis subsp. tardiflorus]
MSETENKSVEITKGVNGLEKIILREIRGSSAEARAFLRFSPRPQAAP